MMSFIEMVPLQKDAIKFINFRNTAVLPKGSTNVKGVEFY